MYSNVYNTPSNLYDNNVPFIIAYIIFGFDIIAKKVSFYCNRCYGLWGLVNGLHDKGIDICRYL